MNERQMIAIMAAVLVASGPGTVCDGTVDNAVDTAMNIVDEVDATRQREAQAKWDERNERMLEDGLRYWEPRLEVWQDPDDYVEPHEARLLYGLLHAAPLLALAFFRPALTPVVRVWFRDLEDEGVISKEGAFALYSRFGLVTGQVENWTDIAKTLNIGKMTAKRRAAQALMDLWIHTGVVKVDTRRGALREVAGATLKNCFPPEHWAREDQYPDSFWTRYAPGYIPSEYRAKGRLLSLWDEDSAQHPERIKDAEPHKIMPWL
jgi:hypothetical protein